MTDCVSREDILDVREEIRDDAIEQFEIVHQELWYIDVTDCSKSYQLLQQSNDHVWPSNATRGCVSPVNKSGNGTISKVMAQLEKIAKLITAIK